VPPYPGGTKITLLSFGRIKLTLRSGVTAFRPTRKEIRPAQTTLRRQRRYMKKVPSIIGHRCKAWNTMPGNATQLPSIQPTLVGEPGPIVTIARNVKFNGEPRLVAERGTVCGAGSASNAPDPRATCDRLNGDDDPPEPWRYLAAAIQHYR
jgi:hypothetical protein